MSSEYWDRESIPQQALDLIKPYERLVLRPYDDGYGFWTIGYGARVDINGNFVTRNTPAVTEDEAETMLARDLKARADAVAGCISMNLRNHQAGALISLAFNIASSAAGLQKAASTLIRYVNNGDWGGASRQFKEYINADGRPSLGLRRRRWAEASVFMGANTAGIKELAEKHVISINSWPPFSIAVDRPVIAVTEQPPKTTDDLNERVLRELKADSNPEYPKNVDKKG
jgi:lysozyme